MRAWIDLVEGRVALAELQGIKSHPRQFEDQRDFINFMADEGFHCLGDGSYGAVFTHRAFYGRYVLKLFNDSFYEAFIRLAQAHPKNPCFPKFVGRVIPVTKTARMVRIEVLKELGRADVDRIWWSEDTSLYMLVNAAEDVADGKRTRESCDFVPDDKRDFFEALILLKRHMPAGAQGDLSSDNIMKRGDTLVITDPWSGAERFVFGSRTNEAACPLDEGFDDLSLDLSPERERELIRQGQEELAAQNPKAKAELARLKAAFEAAQAAEAAADPDDRLDKVWARIEAETAYLAAVKAAGKSVPQGRKPRPEGFKSGRLDAFYREVVQAGQNAFGAEPDQFDLDTVKEWVAHHRALFKKGRVRVYRSMQVDPDWVEALQADQEVGQHWTWDLDTTNFYEFDMNMKDFSRPIITIEADIETRDIEKATTVAYNCCFEGEKEVFLHRNAKPVIVAVRLFDHDSGNVGDENLRPDLVGKPLRP